VRFSSSGFSVNEAAGSATVTVTLNTPSSVPAAVQYTTLNGTALAGSDYVATSGTVTFAPGATTATFPVPILDDPFDEPNETVALTLSTAISASLGIPASATLTIVDNDPPRIFLPVIMLNFAGCFGGTGEVEPNDTSAQATGPLCFNRLYSGSHSTGSAPDRDYFSLALLNASSFTVDLDNVTSGAGVQLQLFYQNTSTRVGFGASEPFTITCPPGTPGQIPCTGAAGTYYILVFTPGGYSGPAYNLTVTSP
ncbi:MAG: Calx-beta domain-containing protein, partial [Anaerolineales bacterium]